MAPDPHTRLINTTSQMNCQEKYSCPFKTVLAETQVGKKDGIKSKEEATTSTRILKGVPSARLGLQEPCEEGQRDKNQV
jgi:hypothetical protein